MKHQKQFLAFALLCFIGLFSLQAIQGQEDTDELFDMSLEELMNLEITSVSKKAERLQDVPSAIYVITPDDIERSTAQNLMHLIRESVPGFWAAQNDYKNMDGLVRNINEGSVLILLDGTPLLDITSFNLDLESFDIPFHMIDRIEVIKGSGGTVYGANSASGVINIFTKSPADTDKLFVGVDAAYPGKIDLNLIATPVKTEKFSTVVYGKYNYFNGFEQMASVENSSSTVPKLREDNDTLIFNRFTGDDNTFQSVNAGFNTVFIPNDNLRLSSNLNLVSSMSDRYRQYFSRENGTFILRNGNPSPTAQDSAFLGNNNKTRLTANVRADYNISENHSVFARISTNYENKDYNFAGGYHGNNAIYDIEVQDNIALGFNSISVGANYRVVDYNLSFYPTSTINFIEPSTNEALIGFFAQDKLTFLDEKVDLYLGVKAENFSLINDKFYFSPMAKIAVRPTEGFTIWGGFTQSYTTPGFNQTNVELDIFRAYSSELMPFYYAGAYPLVEQGVYLDVFNSTLGMGADSATAQTQAQGYIESPGGMMMIDSLTTLNAQGQLSADYPNGEVTHSAVNGQETEPTSFQNFELGVKFSLFDRMKVESNFFYSIMENGLGSSTVGNIIESPTRPGDSITAYYYGNYLKGHNLGLETVVKTQVLDNLMVELSHNYFDYAVEYQENSDFDITGLKYDENDYPVFPEHVFRLKVYYDIVEDLKLSVSGAVTSKYFIRGAAIVPTYQEQEQRFAPLYGDGGTQKLIGGEFDNRLILNIRLDKSFLDNRLNVYLYGHDITSAPFVEGLNQLETVYPRQIGGMYGLGVNYTF